jgi:hypothetical protein
LFQHDITLVINQTFLELAATSGVAPTIYNATMTLWSGTILASQVSYKKLIPINKTIRAGNLSDFTQVSDLSSSSLTFRA